jgi:hypothetical protein
MAAKAGTILTLTTVNSSSPKYLTFAAPTTAATSGVYFDFTGYKNSRAIFVVDITSTSIDSASAQNRVRVNKGSTIIKLSAYGIGALNIQLSSALPASGKLGFIGPLEAARFMDSNERITISCSGGGCNIKGIAAIII